MTRRLVHHRRSLDLSRQLLSANPNDVTARQRVHFVHFHIGHALWGQGHIKEALEQHYLPHGKEWLEGPVDERTDSREAHRSYVAHALVGDALLEHEPEREEVSRKWKPRLVVMTTK